MADIFDRDKLRDELAKHIPTAASGSSNRGAGGGSNYRYCTCDEKFVVEYADLGDKEHNTTPLLDAKIAAHLADVALAWVEAQMSEEFEWEAMRPQHRFATDWEPLEDA